MPRLSHRIAEAMRRRPQDREHDISQITDYLYVGEWPLGRDAEGLKALNIRLILAMLRGPHPHGLAEEPLRLVELPTIDSPLTPIPLRVLYRGVQEALPVIFDGYSVLVHCRHGRHRSVAMACAILIAMGYTANQAMALVCERRSRADPYAWHIRRRIVAFERAWRDPNAFPVGVGRYRK
ncbi:MAG: dual specificity protein phosphatase [Anaerolineae bacterium]